MTLQDSTPLSRHLVWLMSIACLISIGSLYYNQPVLVLISQTFQVSVLQVSAVPTLTQIGYAVGMLLFIPLGDRCNRPQLIVSLSLLNAIALLLMAFSPNFQWLVVMSFINGMTAVTPQLIVPFAAQLALPSARGKVVGMVMCGLLGGIVVGRLVSGLAGAWWGWRSIFWMSAIVLVGLAAILSRALPDIPVSVKLSYAALMRSLFTLLATFPLLRETSLMGGLFFSVYCGFWTTLPFLLAQPPFNFGSQVAGTMGVVGLIGVMAAPIVGRIADRRSPRLTVITAIAILMLSLLTLWQFQASLGGILIGAMLLDLGIQTGQISNQTRIYSLPVEAHNRITTVYMVSYFLGGSVGSWMCAYGWKVAGWTGVCSLSLAAVAIAAIVLWSNRKGAGRTPEY